MFLQVGERFKLFTTSFTFPRIGVMNNNLMVVVIGVTTKLFVAQITIVVSRILLMTLQISTSRKFFATDFTGCRIYVVHRSLMMIVIDQLAKLFVANITVVVLWILLVTL